ncbi:MAG TPA: hypothetical protein VK476_04270 [Flavobacterium sp.]|nr:hypothetical protein [Flavobacterium sp.]
MAGFAETLKLVDNFTIDVDLPKKDFVQKLSNIVYKGKGTGLNQSSNDFLKLTVIYKGTVGPDRFKIKRIRWFLDPHSNMAAAEGIISENNGRTRVDIEVSGLTPLFLAFYAFLFFVYFGGIAYFMFKYHEVVYSAPILIAQGIVMAAFPYIIMRRSVHRLKYDLDREFFYLTKK